MKIDLTYPISQELLGKFLATAVTDKDFDKFGHFGTHFDVMDKIFPLEYCERKGKIFDVHTVKGNEINIQDIDISSINENDFVIFFTGVLGIKEYGAPDYFMYDLVLSHDLIHCLIEKKVSIIGVDMQGVRKGAEHPVADKLCANNSIFVVENMNNLRELFEATKEKTFNVHTYPITIVGATGLPTRVIAEI